MREGEGGRGRERVREREREGGRWREREREGGRQAGRQADKIILQEYTHGQTLITTMNVSRHRGENIMPRYLMWADARRECDEEPSAKLLQIKIPCNELMARCLATRAMMQSMTCSTDVKEH